MIGHYLLGINNVSWRNPDCTPRKVAGHSISLFRLPTEQEVASPTRDTLFQSTLLKEAYKMF